MSDYVRNKVLRAPFPETFLKKYNTDNDIAKVANFIAFNESPKLGKYFEISITTGSVYLDLVLDHSYGDECGEFGIVRELNKEQQDRYRLIFEQIIPDIDMSTVRYVDYCWYNCCEAPDYYEIEELDI